MTVETHLALDDQIRRIANALTTWMPIEQSQLSDYVNELNDIADKVTAIGLANRQAVATQRLTNDLFAALLNRGVTPKVITRAEVDLIRNEGWQVVMHLDNGKCRLDLEQ